MSVRYQWFSPEFTAMGVEALIGKKVKILRKGNLETGEFATIADGEGTKFQVPLTRKGVEIEFDETPTLKQLAMLDKALKPYKRAGVMERDLEIEIDELKAQVTALEAVVKVEL